LSGDRTTVTVCVALPPAETFSVFTEEIDLWWRTGPRFRVAGRQRGQLRFEGRPGGRLFETFGTGKGAHTVELGRITAWEPPSRLEFEWRGVNFTPGESTFVEVCFAAVGEGTHVTVVHRGWLGLPEDHPVRHGKRPADFIRGMGQWWGELLTALREHAARGPVPQTQAHPFVD
jgi:uncharacterized protein YndB with AHSA1/START domain